MYIWAVTNGHIVEASLGYFINPLVSVAFGVFFFKDRLTRLQLLGLVLAAGGVIFLTIAQGKPPIISLALAVSFALYGLIRKKTVARPIPGLLIETIVLMPLAAGYLIYLGVRGENVFLSGSWRADLLLLAAGTITITPLVWFVEAAKRLTLSTMGFLQYIAPSGQFLLGVLVYGEAFPASRAVAFAAIWSALVLYSISLVRTAHRNRPLRSENR
jgi:chloramphenicol-sensitive protein RarD